MSTPLQDALPEIEALVARTAAEEHCPSIAWGIVVDGALAAHGSTGTLDDGSTPGPQTVYRIASMTKSFTAAAVLCLRDEGALSLDDTLAMHAPEFAHLRAPFAGGAPIRIRHLLSMSSGLANDDPWADRHMDYSDAELEHVVRDGALFAGATGEVFEYSNLGYGLLGRVVRNITGAPLQACVNTRLLAPLGMTRTTWNAPSSDAWARPYRVEDGQCLPEGGPIPGDGALAPMGGLWSTVEDLARWVAWFADAFPARGLAGEADGDASPLSRATRREMQQMHRYLGQRKHGGVRAPAGYGYGLTMRDDPALGWMAAHSGGLPGYGSNMRWLGGGIAGATDTGGDGVPTHRRVGAIALANVTYAPMVELTYAMLTVLHARGAIAAPAGTSPALEQAARALVSLLAAWDDDTARDLFTDNVVFDERFERRRAAGIRLRERCGVELRITRILAASATSGRIELANHDGEPASIDLQLAPLVPARVQYYVIR